MGSMGKRRGRRTRSDSGGRRRNLEEGFPTFEHNQWTFEGEIERLGVLARAFNRRKRDPEPRPLARNAAGHLTLVLLGLLLALALAAPVAYLLRDLL